MSEPKGSIRDTGRSSAGARDLLLVRAALRPRRTDRPLEDTVRVFVRRWRSAVDGGGSGGGVDPLARV